jgi:uncharacterized protein (DUF58 family)
VSLLPSPGVRLEDALIARALRLAAAARAVRLREEGLRARGSGAGFEFEGYREYQPGDDPREIDWDLLAREPERVAVRVRRSEQGALWQLLLDDSASMGLGARGKLQCAAELALTVAAWGLFEGASVTLAASSGARAPLAEQIGELPEVARWLESLVAQGGTQLPARSPSLRAQHVFVFSDFSQPTAALARLVPRAGTRLLAVEILSPEEREPPEAGEWLLVDPESGAQRRLSASPERAAEYRRALEARSQQLDQWARATRGACVHLSAAASLEQGFASLRESLRR